MTVNVCSEGVESREVWEGGGTVCCAVAPAACDRALLHQEARILRVPTCRGEAPPVGPPKDPG